MLEDDAQLKSVQAAYDSLVSGNARDYSEHLNQFPGEISFVIYAVEALTALIELFHVYLLGHFLLNSINKLEETL